MKYYLNLPQGLISCHKSKNFSYFLLLVSILFFPYSASSNSDFTSIKANTLETFFNKLNLNYDQSLHQCYKKYYIADWHKALAIAYLENNLKDGISNSDVVFICVGTPTKKNSFSADLSQVYKVAREIRKNIK